MLSFRLDWLKKRLLSKEYYLKIKKEVVSPVRFYTSIIPHLAGNNRSVKSVINSKSGLILELNSFMAFYIFDEIFIQNVYNYNINPKKIIDIGANIGLFSVWASKRWSPYEIISIEPEPINFSMLERNINLNNMKYAKTINAAVNSDGREIDLYVHKTNTGGHSTVKKIGSSIKVKATRLEPIICQLDGGKCDLLKMDCEGAEFEIIMQIDSDLSSRIGAIIYETEPTIYSVNEVNQHLQRLGYKIQQTDRMVFATK